jgi:uncharacterized protein
MEPVMKHQYRRSVAVRWTRAVIGMRFITLLSIAIVTIALGGYAVRNLSVDNSLESWAMQDAPELQTLYDFRDTFGKADAFILLVEGDVFSRGFLTRLKALHREVEALEVDIDHQRGRGPVAQASELETPALSFAFEDDENAGAFEGHDFEDQRVMDSVTSLVNVRRTITRDDGLRVEPLLRSSYKESELAALKTAVLNDPFFVGQVVDADGRFAVLSAIPINMPDDELLKVNPAVVHIVNRFDEPGFRVLCTGLPSIGAEINAMVQHDFTLLGSVSLTLVVLMLVILFRSRVGVFGPFLVVVTSVVWTVGFMALAGFSLSILSTILPAFLFCVGVADSVHFLSIYGRGDQACSSHLRILETASIASAPIFFTSLTTMGGLFSLSFASVRVISELGIAGGVGVLFAWFLSVTLLPALMSFSGHSHSSLKTQGVNTSDWCDKGLALMVNLSKPNGGQDRYRAVLVVGGLVFIWALIGISNLRVYHDDLELVPADSKVRLAVETLDRNVGGAAVAEMMISGPAGVLKSRGVLVAIERFIDDVMSFDDGVDEMPLVSHATSIVDIAKETNRALHGNDPAHYEIPGTDLGLSEVFLLFENQSPEATKRLVTLDWSVTHVRFRVRWREATAYQPLVAHIKNAAKRHLEPRVEGRGTGSVFIASGLVSLLLHDLSLSFGTAFVFVTLLMIVMLRDLKLGLIAMLPNLLPIALVLGYMGWTELPIDLNSLLVASIALGIAVDDTVHFLHHFKSAYAETGNVEVGVERAVTTAGRAMVMTSIVLVTGFLVFLFASTNASMRFGLLTAITIICALVVDMTVLPAALRSLYPGGPSQPEHLDGDSLPDAGQPAVRGKLIAP